MPFIRSPQGLTVKTYPRHIQRPQPLIRKAPTSPFTEHSFFMPVTLGSQSQDMTHISPAPGSHPPSRRTAKARPWVAISHEHGRQSQEPGSHLPCTRTAKARTRAAKARTRAVILAGPWLQKPLPRLFPWPHPGLNDHLSSQVLDTLDKGSRVGSRGG